MTFRLFLLLIAAAPLQAASVVIDTFTGSYLNRDIAYVFAGNARVVTSGGNPPTAPSGANPPNITVLGQLIRVSNTSTNAIARFEFLSPQTFVRINYQNGTGAGASGGVGVTEIRFESVPEPTTTALFALSSLILLRRRCQGEGTILFHLF